MDLKALLSWVQFKVTDTIDRVILQRRHSAYSLQSSPPPPSVPPPTPSDLIGMMKGAGKISIHAEEKKKKRKRGKISDNCEALGMKVEEDSSMLVEKMKKSSNLKRKNKVKNLVEKTRPNVQVDLKEHSDRGGDNYSLEALLIENFKEPKEIDTRPTMQAGKSKKTKKKREKEAHSVKEDLNSPENRGVTDQDVACTISSGDEDCSKGIKSKSKKTKKKRKKEAHSVKEALNSPENGGVTDQDEAYSISSGDEDCSKGMKKWITEYHQSRPGLQALQDQIDDFITVHEEKLEEERKEREARAAEGGWTVVVHHKGRKKTTDSGSGIVVGSVAQAAVEQKAAKKKHKEVALNFYRFQKKEAQRNEIMMLQSKFEEDKKRLQQLRASRKFRPY